MSDRITPKAASALSLVAAGKAHLLSRQMIDRLSKGHLIDITGTSDGWFITEEGLEALWAL